MRKYDDSQEFLLQYPQLACEETANYLVIWCINLEVEEVSTCIQYRYYAVHRVPAWILNLEYSHFCSLDFIKLKYY